MKLRVKVTAAFAFLIVAPFLVVGWLSSYTATETMKDELGRTTLQLVMQNHATIEKTMSAVNERTITFLDNYFFGPSGSSFWMEIESLGDIRRADAILGGWSSNGTDFSLYMFNTRGKQPPIDLTNRSKGFNYMSVNPNAADLPDWTRLAIMARGAGTFRPVKTEDGTTEVRFMRSILDAYEYDRILGFLVVSNMQPSLSRDMLSVRLPERAGLFLFNALGEPLLQAGDPAIVMETVPDRMRRETEGYYFAEQQGKQWLFAYSARAAFDTRLIYQVPLESITASQTRFQWLMMIVSAIYLGCVLLFLLYLLRIIVNPLGRLVALTRIYEPGKPLEAAEPPRSDEFGILYGAILKMTRRLNQTFEENYVMKIKQKENELAALHAQITPHLLYNTLDSIYWYAIDSGNEGVGDMVKDLSKLLRIGLSKGRTLITVGEELEHAQAYCRLQSARYPNAFIVEWDVDEAAKPYMSPKVILQPLIENAIFHAVSGMAGEGEICIQVRLAANTIEMTVADNGFLPVDPDRLEAILRGEASDAGYGIRNVHQRIQLHFGEAYGLSYARRDSGGLAAAIRIPAREPDKGMNGR